MGPLPPNESDRIAQHVRMRGGRKEDTVDPEKNEVKYIHSACSVIKAFLCQPINTFLI